MTGASGNFLSIDTALGETGIAVWRAGRIAARFHEPSREDQAALLLKRVEETMTAAGVSYPELEGIAVCVGPGGFTSIRVGLAAARGIGFAGKIPVHGYSTLHLMRYGAGEADAVAILPAGRGQVFFQQGEEPPQLLDVHALADIKALVTTLKGIPASRLISHDVARNAEFLAQMLASGVPALSPEPLYIKPPDAKPQASLLERLGKG